MVVVAVFINLILSLTIFIADEDQVEHFINVLSSEQRVLLKKQRDLENFASYQGINLEALDRKLFAAMKANLPML